MMNNNRSTGKEKLVVEVVSAINLMPKDGEGSSSPFVEVEFENQRLRTQVKYKDLNPVWNEKLVFHINDIADLTYRTLEVNIFNERRSSNSRNFLGKVRVSGSAIVKEGEEIPQLYTLDKRSLFSHIRGEISLKTYVSNRENVKETGFTTNNGPVISSGSGPRLGNATGFTKKNKKTQQTPTMSVQQQQQQQQTQRQPNNKQQQIGQPNKGNQPGQTHNHSKPVEPNQGEIKPVVVTNVHGPVVSAAGSGGGNVGNGGGVSFYSNEFSLKETSPHLGGGLFNRDKTGSTYDLVEQMQYLYVKVVKARDLFMFGNNGDNIVAEVKLGNYRGVTKKGSGGNLDWNQVFAFSKDCIQSSMVEVHLKEGNKDDFFGRVWFDLNEVPKRVPPDSQLAPQWYRVEDKKGEKSKGEIMVSIWFGTQADEAFPEAWHSKAANVHFDGLSSLKSKVYLSPKLWYLRVSVIEAQDIVSGDKTSNFMRFPELSAKVQVGNQVMRTRIASASSTRSLSNPYWNEDLVFVVAEPFEDYLLVSVEDRVVPGRDDLVGRVLLPVGAIERRNDEKPVVSRWFNLDNQFGNSGLGLSKPVLTRFGSRIHLRVSLDGGYHVLDEATMYSSDVKPTSKQLWKPNIGLLEMGILGASGLIPMKLKDGKCSSTDAYCVAKYGQKWVRTRTVVDSLCPKWNEQYTWEVYDPCTVITIGVFDSCRVDQTVSGPERDSRIGKVRIRLSTLESERVYTHSYPLLMLHNTGVKKMGELHLAVRFSCSNMGNMLHMYSKPLLPKMHYVLPLTVNQLESLRYQAMNVVAVRLSRAEPPLGREVVEYMLDHDSHMWSMRRSKANFFRLMNVISGLVSTGRWVDSIRNWNRPVYSALFIGFFLLLVLLPELIIPTLLFYMAVLGGWRYRVRPRQPSHMDTRISHAESVYPDELDEEFDSFPTSRSGDVVRMRYDRLRSVAGRIQTVVGDMATQCERLEALLSWRDPRATFLFVMFCLFAAVGFYAVPIRVVVAVWGVYVLRPPRFRSKLPSQALSFFRRLPSKADSLL